MMRVLFSAVVFLVGMQSAWAEDLLAPPSCAPTEPHTYCALILQRNDALNRLAKIDAEVWDLRNETQRLRDYLHGYISGTNWIGGVLPLLIRACARSVENKPKPLVELCAKFWKG